MWPRRADACDATMTMQHKCRFIGEPKLEGMNMTTEKEQEAFGLVLERQKNGASENDIRTAFQRFLETASVAAASEMTTEVPPGQGNPGRMDLYVHNTCIEFKTNIVRNGQPVLDNIAQLDGYLESLLKAGAGVRNGILTDGIHYLLRRVGGEKLPLQRPAEMRTYDRPEQVHNLREYLHGIISAPAKNISPTTENLERLFGSDSDAFLARKPPAEGSLRSAPQRSHSRS